MSDSDSFIKLKKELKTLFRSEDKDLNFGIYRIMNQLNKEIDEFIDKELPKIVEEKILELQKYKTKDIDVELEELRKSLEKARIDPLSSPAYKELLEKKKENRSINELEDDVYNNLVRFFSRYYQDGDFITKFYFNDQTYLMPYDGSEVELYWPTKDMYFVKMSDNYQRFSFTDDNVNLVLKVVATEENKGTQKQKDLYFDIDNIEKINDEFVVSFKRIPSNDEIDSLGKNKIEKQNKLNQKISETIKEKTGIKTDIEKNLEKFQRRYTEDYFIHNNLKEFLEKQLIFFINQELLNIDSIFSKNGEIREDKRIMAITFRDIALNIIEKLSLLENLKKNIWEKKKFVLESNYVITLDKIAELCGEEFLEKIIPKILANNEQISEWNELFSIIVKTKKDLLVSESQQRLTDNEIQWKKLPIDSKYFSQELKWQLLSNISNLDENLNGILIHSENWQALNLIEEKFKQKIKCCYIDPPYNTGEDEFAYVDRYSKSSWLSMIYNRISLIKNSLSNDGILFSSIDDHQLSELRIIFDKLFGIENRLDRGTIIWANKGSTKGFNKIVKNHEYIISSSNNQELVKSVYGQNFAEEMDSIEHYCHIAPNPGNPPCQITFKKGCKIRGIDNVIFEHTVGDEVKLEIISGKMIFQNGELINDVTLRGCFPYRFQIEDYFENKVNGIPTYDYKGQEWEEIYFNSNGLPRYKKARKFRIISSLINDPSIPHYGSEDLKNLFNENKATFPKPYKLIYYLISYFTTDREIIADFFLGSGTTIHSVISLNRDTKMNRIFLGCEITNSFNDIILPRTKKLLFAIDWSRGKYTQMDSIGGFFKYHELEQYEDALENVQFKQLRIDSFDNYGKLLQYYLEDGIDTNKSKNFLGVDTEKEFLDLKIKVLNKDGTTRDQNVDLIETFNYLIGIEIQQMKKLSNEGIDYYIVTGVVKDNSTIVIWRDPKVDKEKDKEFINKLLQERPYKEIYVNSDCLIKNYKNIYDEMRKRLW